MPIKGIDNFQGKLRTEPNFAEVVWFEELEDFLAYIGKFGLLYKEHEDMPDRPGDDSAFKAYFRDGSGVWFGVFYTESDRIDVPRWKQIHQTKA